MAGSVSAKIDPASVSSESSNAAAIFFAAASMICGCIFITFRVRKKASQP
jgi:hypothetical protein